MLTANPVAQNGMAARARPVLPRTALDHLNWVRGLAAIAVLVGHVRGLFFVDFDDLPRRSLGLTGFYLLSGLGHEAVIVFFVLSGFFIGTSVLGVTDARPFSWGRFLLNRGTRLYVVLVPALALTACWDLAGMYVFGTEHTVYAGEFPGRQMALNDVRQTIGVATLLGNLAFLQDQFVKPYGSNGPMWSLSYEFWFYLVFPLLVAAASGGARRPYRAAMAASAVAVMLVGGTTFLLYFAIWGLGAAVAGAWPRLTGFRAPRSPAAAGLTGLLFLTALVAARARLLGPVWRGDLALGVATALFVAALLLAGARGTAAPPPWARLRAGYASLGETLANCSYTLYLVHYPPLVFLYAWAFRSSRWSPALPQILAACAIAAAVLVVYAYPLSRVTEARTDRVRELIARGLGVGRRNKEPAPVPVLP